MLNKKIFERQHTYRPSVELISFPLVKGVALYGIALVSRKGKPSVFSFDCGNIE